MPFTPAHVAAVLPGLGRRRPAVVVPAALVVGSMVPDVLYFVPVGDYRALSHSLRGVVTLDLLLGLVSLAAWWLVAAPVVRDLAPGWVRVRMPVPRPPGLRVWLWSVPWVVAGALTHVAWDSFTHVDGWVVRHSRALTDPGPGGYPPWEVAQYASSVVGVVVVAVWCVQRLREAAPVHPATALSAPAQRHLARALLLAAPVLGAVAFVAVTPWAVGVQMLLYVAVVRGLSAFGLAATAVAVWWHLRRREPAAV